MWLLRFSSAFQTADGLGIAVAHGRYHNDPITETTGSSSQTGGLTGGTQQLPPGVEASTSLSEKLASVSPFEHTTAKLDRASVPEWSFLGEHVPQAFNSTSLDFMIPPTPEYQTQMLCFRSSKESSAPLTEFQEPLGYVFFIKDVYAACKWHRVESMKRRWATKNRSHLGCGAAARVSMFGR